MVSLIKKRLTIFKHKRMSEQVQLNFLKQLFRLLTNGYSLLEALKMFRWDEHLNDLANQLMKHLKAGLSIDEAFEKVGFHHTIIAFIYFARIHGNLSDSLKKCIAMLEQRMKAMQKFQQVIRYPLILTFFFVGLLFSIKQTVLPAFINLYEAQGTMSTILNISIKFINLFFILLPIGGLVGLCFILFWLYYKRHIHVSRLIKIYHSIPFLRQYMTLKTSYQLAVHLSSLFKTRLNPAQILDIMAKQNELPVVAHIAQYATNQLLQGFNLGESLHSYMLIDEQFAYILRKNPNMETLANDLNMYVEMSQEQIHERMMKYISLIQPVFLVTIASMIIFLYVSLMWPMFQLIQTI